MTLPVGVSTFELVFGNTVDFEGNPLRTDLIITPSHEIVWEATGDRLVPMRVSAGAAADAEGSVLLPHTDQAGFVDLAGNAITDWWYTVRSTDWQGRTASPTKTRRVQVTSDVESVDLDLIPTDGVVGPVGSVPGPVVTSVNGATGAVVIDGGGSSLTVLPEAEGDAGVATTARAISAARLKQQILEHAPAGAVSSVAGKTGAVSLVKGDVGLGNVDNTSDMNKPVSTAQAAADATKAPLTHTHAQSDVTGLTTALAGKSDTGHAHTAANITDFNTAADARVAAGITGKLDSSAAPELIRDTIGTALVAGANVTITPDDGSDTITIAATGGGGGITTEDAVDAVAAALTEGNDVDIAYDDGAGTVTLTVGGAVVRAVIVTTGSEARPAGDVVVWIDPDELGAPNKLSTDLHWTPEVPVDISGKLDTSAAPELVRDTMGTALVAGANVTITPNDGGDTITIAATGGSSGGAIGQSGAIVAALPGGWIGTYEGVTNGNFIATVLNTLYVVPLWIPADVNVDEIGIAVTTAASAGGVVRLGVYNAKANGMPGTVRFDAGTVAADSTGVKKITITQALPTGLYYLAAVSQVAVATLRSDNPIGASRFGRDPYDPQFFDGTAAVNYNALKLAGVTGALPDLTSATLVGHDSGVRVGLRRA